MAMDRLPGLACLASRVDHAPRRSAVRAVLGRLAAGFFASLLRVGMAVLADSGIFYGFPPIRGGLDTLHHAPRGAIEGRRGARNTDARSRERRSTDAPPRRHRSRRAGYGGAGGCQRGAGARYE